MVSVQIACNQRCSVYLNNVGCSLMRRGAFEEARETFNDAVLVMKLGVAPFTTTYCRGMSSTPIDAVDSTLELGSRIKRADQRMALHQTSKMISNSGLDVFEILEPAEYSDIDLDYLLCKQDHHLICPIRIETDLAFSPTVDNEELTSGIMLFNLGLSYSCLAKCDPESPSCQELRAAATRIFQLADCIVYRMLTDAKAIKIMNRDFEIWKISATTSMAVLHSLFQLFVDRRGSEDSMLVGAHEEVYERLSFLQDHIYMHECSRLRGRGVQQDSDCNGAPAA